MNSCTGLFSCSHWLHSYFSEAVREKSLIRSASPASCYPMFCITNDGLFTRSHWLQGYFLGRGVSRKFVTCIAKSKYVLYMMRKLNNPTRTYLISATNEAVRPHTVSLNGSHGISVWFCESEPRILLNQRCL